MMKTRIDSEFLRYLIEQGFEPGDRLPSLAELSREIGISVGKLREQLEVARTLGLVEASPRRGITRTAYSFLPPVRLSLFAALALDASHFNDFSGLRVHLETAYWDEAVSLLTVDDKACLQALVRSAMDKLSCPRIQIPYIEHRRIPSRRLSSPRQPLRRRPSRGLLGCLRSCRAEHLRRPALPPRGMGLPRAHRRRYLCPAMPPWASSSCIEHMQLLSKRGVSIERVQAESVEAEVMAA